MNGHVHASLSVLRSALELMFLHAFWKQQRQIAESYESFYEWLQGQTSAPSASKLICALYSAHNLPSCSPTDESVRALYAQLCSYAHKPIISEAVISIRGGNTAEASQELLTWWLEILVATQRVLLDVLIRSAPACLFPIDIVRKFGFSPPVGIFFDSSNGFALEGALGHELLRAYREAFAGADPPASQLEWVRERPDLTDDQIRQSWEEDQPWDERGTFEMALHRGLTLIKAKMRAHGLWFAYSAVGPSLPDFGDILKSPSEENAG